MRKKTDKQIIDDLMRTTFRSMPDYFKNEDWSNIENYNYKDWETVFNFMDKSGLPRNLVVYCHGKTQRHLSTILEEYFNHRISNVL